LCGIIPIIEHFAARNSGDWHGEFTSLHSLRTTREEAWQIFSFFSTPPVGEYFARERLRLDPNDPESVERYLSKATQAQAYVETMRLNTMRGRRRRAIQDHMMPTGRSKWAHDYYCYRKDSHRIPDATSGRYTVNPERAGWVRKWADWILVDGVSINKCCQRMLDDSGIRIHRSTMVDVLSDPALIGKFYAYTTKVVRDATGRKRKTHVDENGWLLVYEDPSQAIITQEQFYALRERFQRNKENSPRNTKHYYPPLKSLIFHSCGRRLVGVCRNGSPWYRCLPCRAWIKAIPLWEEIREGLRGILLQPERLIPAIKAQIDSGQSVEHLEEELRQKQQRIEMLEQAEQKALRLHLFLPNYPIDKLEAELSHVEEQKKQLIQEINRIEQQIRELRQAKVDEEGVKRFCEIVASNLNNMDDSRWRLLLEAMNLRVLVSNKTAVKVAVPAAKEGDDVIALCTSQSDGRLDGHSCHGNHNNQTI